MREEDGVEGFRRRRSMREDEKMKVNGEGVRGVRSEVEGSCW